jgi:CMP-2-keto-3-deoxyoctulosonic acid synthetase
MSNNNDRRHTKRKPPRATIARYGERIVEVLDHARGQRVMIRSLHSDGSERLAAVKLTNLRALDDQLF